MGPARAGEMLQRWLNGFNATARATPTCSSTARIGEVTLDALRQYLRWRGAEGSKVMVAALNCTQGARYLELAEKRQRQEVIPVRLDSQPRAASLGPSA
jgi:lysozyme family protein